MVTISSHWVIMGKTLLPLFLGCFIRSFYALKRLEGHIAFGS